MTTAPRKRGRPRGSRYEEGHSPMAISLTTEERDLILQEAEIDALPGPLWARSELMKLVRARRRARERAAKKNGGA